LKKADILLLGRREIMGKFWALIEVLYVGKSLKDPAKWKNLQSTLNGGLLTVLLATGRLLPETLNLSDADLYQIAEAVGIIGVAINTYLTMATSEKVGISRKSR